MTKQKEEPIRLSIDEWHKELSHFIHRLYAANYGTSGLAGRYTLGVVQGTILTDEQFKEQLWVSFMKQMKICRDHLHRPTTQGVRGAQ